MAVAKVNMITSVQKKALWAAAADKGLTKEDLYSIILSVSGQESMSAMSYVEGAKVLDRINNKESYEKKNQKRTDEGGNPETIRLRRKIYALTSELGWNDNNERISGFVKKIFKVDRIEWLNMQQCHKLIEMLKKMVKEKKDV